MCSFLLLYEQAFPSYCLFFLLRESGTKQGSSLSSPMGKKKECSMGLIPRKFHSLSFVSHATKQVLLLSSLPGKEERKLVTHLTLSQLQQLICLSDWSHKRLYHNVLQDDLQHREIV